MGAPGRLKTRGPRRAPPPRASRRRPPGGPRGTVQHFCPWTGSARKHFSSQRDARDGRGEGPEPHRRRAGSPSIHRSSSPYATQPGGRPASPPRARPGPLGGRGDRGAPTPRGRGPGRVPGLLAHGGLKTGRERAGRDSAMAPPSRVEAGEGFTRAPQRPGPPVPGPLFPKGFWAPSPQSFPPAPFTGTSFFVFPPRSGPPLRFFFRGAWPFLVPRSANGGQGTAALPSPPLRF